MQIYKELQRKFGKIFLLSLSSRVDRTNSALAMLKNIGMVNSKQIDIHYATEFPYNNIIADIFNKAGKGKFTKANEYDCSRNHYAMVKQAYDLGYDTVLIIEDDIQFLNNEQLFLDYLKEIPEDYDILQFGGFTADPQIEKYLKTDVKWVKHPDVGVWNCSMYALSRKGMQFYINFMNKFFWVADGPLYKAPINDKIVNTYLSNIPLVIQADKNIVSSDIRDENNDKIDYNTMNLYEKYIDKTNYFNY